MALGIASRAAALVAASFAAAAEGFAVCGLVAMAYVPPTRPGSDTALASSASAAPSGTTSAPSASSGEPIRGVVFDIDGTLADSWELGYRATLTVLAEHRNEGNGYGDAIVSAEDYPLTSEEYHYGCRYTTPERLARHVGLEPDHPSFESVGEELGRRFDDYYVRLVDGATAGFYDGVGDLLARLNRGEVARPNGVVGDGSGGVRLGALTNACVEYAHAVLKANCPRYASDVPPAGSDAIDSIYERFSSVHGANSVPRPKPFGDGILKCCEEMGLRPSQVVYVGDAPTDARAAVDAGCRAAIGVLWGSNDEETLGMEGGFDVLCSSVEELEAAIGKYL